MNSVIKIQYSFGILFITVMFFTNGYAQKTFIESPGNYIFYRGVDNPFTIYSTDNDCNSYFLSATNGEIHGKNCEYIYRPDKTGPAEIHFNKITGSDTVLTDTKTCRVRELPLPTARVAGLNEGVISKNVLLSQPGVSCSIENFTLDIGVKVTGFRVMILKNNELVFTGYSEDNRFDDKIKYEFKLMKPGDTLYIVSIKAVLPNGQETMTNSIELKIR